MSCEAFATQIARGADLADAALAAHLASCDACRETAELFRAVPLARVAEGTFLRERTLGEGGMGITYAAWDVRLERPVAIKEPRTPELAAQLAREAKLAARLQHPAIVTIYEAGYLVGASSERAFYAMEPIDGVPLDVEIETRPALADRLTLLPHLTTIANAVAYAHEREVIHRDIKPGNILIGRFGEAVLIDWGLAVEVSEDERATIPRAGTPNYMAPEQASGAPADRRVDVYAIGATLYHLLCGVPPYHGADQVRRALLAGPPVPCSEIERRIPRELVAIVSRAMQRYPRERFTNASELARELGRYQTGQLVESYRHSSLELLARWAKRHRAPLAVAAIALAIVAGVGTVSVRGIVRESERADRERDDAIAQTDLAKRFITNQLAAHQAICRIAGEVAAAHDAAGARAAMSRLGQQGTLVSSPELAAAIAALDDGVKRWEHGTRPDGDELAQLALPVPSAAHEAWRHLTEVALAGNASLAPIVANIERDALVDTLLDEAGRVAAMLPATGRDDFERLYWGELYFIEKGWTHGGELEGAMVRLRGWLVDPARDPSRRSALLADLQRASDDVRRGEPM